MPFRKTELSRLHDSGHGWLRRIFIEDWGLKLLALAITLVLWFGVSGRDLQRELLVEPRLEGQPAPGYEVKGALVAPDKVRVTGPASHVTALEKAQTDPISVTGRHESFDVPHLAVHVSDSRVVVLGTVNVHVTIAAENLPAKSTPRDTN